MKIYTYTIELATRWPEDWDHEIKIQSTKKIPRNVFLNMVKRVIKQLREEENDEYLYPGDIADKLIKNNPYYFQKPDIEDKHIYDIVIDGEDKNELSIWDHTKEGIEWVTTYNVKK